MRGCFGGGLLVPLVLLALAGCAVPLRAEPLRFAVMGDTQDASPEGRARTAELFARIAAHDDHIAFIAHIGDLKGGAAPCTDRFYAEQARLLSDASLPIVLTPGDNDWTDCWFGEPAFDPGERLEVLRARFFATGRAAPPGSQGWRVQDGQPENALWRMGDVTFVTLHQVGSNNNMRDQPDAMAEFMTRSSANLVWLEQAFDTADDSAALVILTHANPQWEARWWEPTGFDRFRATLVARARAYARPVLVVHGDTHTFRIDRPVRVGRDTVETITRLEVFGPPDHGAVIVTADPDESQVFSFEPLQSRD